MAEETPEGGSETGGSLRSKYESALEENRTLAAELRSFKAEKLIQEKGYKYVTPEDLKGVGLDELATKAGEVEKSKLQVRETVLRETLASQGYEGTQLDDAVTKLLNPQESHADTSTRLANLGRISGSHPGAADDDGLEGRALIVAGLAENERKNNR